MMKSVLVSFTVLLLLTLVFSRSVYSQIESLEFDDDEEFEEQLPKREVLALPTPQEKKQLEVEDLIHSGDIIDVDVLGSVEYDWRGEIDKEGFLTGVNFLEQSIYASCKTEVSLAKEIASGYSKLLNKPSVIVRILDRSKRPVSSLYGAVSHPQRFKLKRKAFLNELIILSGGFTERASGEIQILRQPKANCVLDKKYKATDSTSKTEPPVEFIKVKKRNELIIINISVSDILKGKKDSNPRILYGDAINVLIAQPIYLIGAVENPTKLSIRPGITISRAIDSAGGLTKGANPKKITLFRRAGGETEVIKVDLDRIKQQEEEDIELKPFDVVQVGGRGNNDSKSPPILRLDYVTEKKISKLPLRVID